MNTETVRLDGDGNLFEPCPYLAYDPKKTRVVVYVIHHSEADRDDPPHLRRGWRQAAHPAAARAEVTREFGKILEETRAGDNLFFRVFKERR